jgi:predicted NBD/HSP70 family sugar kinase
MGFAGEFGHMQFNTSDKLCLCGKRGCLGTTVSGYGLEEAFKEKMAQGDKSILAYDPKSENLRYDDILSAALAGDALSIALVQDIGVNLGKALGNIINFINPEMIVLSGKFSRLGNLLLNSVKTGMTMTALTNVLDMCQTEVSGYDRDAGVMGSAMMVYKCFNLI